MGRPEEGKMDVVKSLAKAKLVAARKAVERGWVQPIVEIAGWFAVPDANELEIECAGAAVVAAFNEAGECNAPVWF